VTPGLNPGQIERTAWRLRLAGVTFDLSPWTLDVPWRYRPAEVAAVVEDWRPAGRLLAFWLHLTFDVVFPLVYAVTLSTAITLAAKPLAIGAGLSAVIGSAPYLAAFADWVENLAIAVLSRRYPHPSPSAARLAWWAASAKWALLAVSLLAITVCLDSDLDRTLAGWGVPQPQLARWQVFYTSTAGGSAAILGLFYVAQSVQGRSRLRHQAGRQHVALTSTFTTVMVLLISLSALWPQQSLPAFGAISLLLVVAYSTVSLWHQRRVGGNLRYQRWRRGRLPAAIVVLIVLGAGGVGAIENSRTGLPLIAGGVMACFGLWAIIALSLLYPQPETPSRAVRGQR
jgi:hypothetical protein